MDQLCLSNKAALDCSSYQIWQDTLTPDVLNRMRANHLRAQGERRARQGEGGHLASPTRPSDCSLSGYTLRCTAVNNVPKPVLPLEFAPCSAKKGVLPRRGNQRETDRASERAGRREEEWLRGGDRGRKGKEVGEERQRERGGQKRLSSYLLPRRKDVSWVRLSNVRFDS